ncbi:Sodium/potassium-transporting ATPase subunit beta family-containing protein [Aphelenchoides fujianensis]|nr:Sodium/potassium-transporting ATPase subunit beta family-containing protein [Aphelenchoides fujianensis]
MDPTQEVVPEKLLNTILIVPGNPGNNTFYDDFALGLSQAFKREGQIFTVSHLNHVPLPSGLAKIDDRQRNERYTLKQQVDHCFEFVQNVVLPAMADRKLVIVGHSIGALIGASIRKRLEGELGLRVFFIGLFPTVERMAEAPAGRRMRKYVNFVRRFDSLARVGLWPFRWVPIEVKRWLVRLFVRPPPSPCVNQAAAELIDALVFRNVAFMAANELEVVLELCPKIEASLSEELFFLYYGLTDHWVPVSFAKEMEARIGKEHVLLDDTGADHAFVLKDSVAIARKVVEIITTSRVTPPLVRLIYFGVPKIPSQVELIRVEKIEEKNDPVSLLLTNFCCSTIEDVRELQENPHRLDGLNLGPEEVKNLLNNDFHGTKIKRTFRLAACTDDDSVTLNETTPGYGNGFENPLFLKATRLPYWTRDRTQRHYRLGTLRNHGLLTPNLTFGIAQRVDQETQVDVIDGIMGLGFQRRGDPESLINRAIREKKLDRPLYTIFLDKVGGDQHRPGGEVLFGEVDTQHCSRRITWAPLTTTRYWQFLAGRLVARNLQVVSDTGTSALVMPAADFKRVMRAIGLSEHSIGLPYVNCRRKFTLEIWIREVKHELTAQELMVRYSDGCVLQIDKSSWDDDTSWVLGDPFCRAFCTGFHSSNRAASRRIEPSTLESQPQPPTRHSSRGREMAKGSPNNGKLNEESNALMANGRAKPAEKSGLASFIYNKEKGTCLGRTAGSWAKITIFYIIFYACLAGFWIACLAAFLKTVDPELPRFYGKGTIIGANPGVGYQPWLKEDPESTLIRFNPKDPKSYAHYVDVLDAYFEKYDNTNNTRDCTGAATNSDIVKDGKLGDGNDEACRFSLKAFERAGCLKSTDYGFKTGNPCVIVTLNRLIGWKPENYAPGEIPAEVAARYKPNSIAFSCGGTHEVDREVEGNIEYVPPEGIDGRFFPYAVMQNYHQPIAMIKFKSLPANRVVMMECRAYAKNIERDSSSGLGLVNFELMRVEEPPTKSK